jgi:hypothetical protein
MVQESRVLPLTHHRSECNTDSNGLRAADLKSVPSVYATGIRSCPDLVRQGHFGWRWLGEEDKGRIIHEAISPSKFCTKRAPVLMSPIRRSSGKTAWWSAGCQRKSMITTCMNAIALSRNTADGPATAIQSGTLLCSKICYFSAISSCFW